MSLRRMFPGLGVSLSMRATLLWAFALTILLSLVPALIIEEAEEAATAALRRIVQVDVRVSDLALHGITTFLDARKHEKDFLLRYREFGFHEARARYAIQAETHVAELREQMQELRDVAVESDIREQIDQIEGAAAEYLAQFMQTVTLYESLAVPHRGLRARLRDSLAALSPAAHAHGEPLLARAYLNLYRAAQELLDDPNPADYQRALEALAVYERAVTAVLPGRVRTAVAAQAGLFRDTAAGILETTIAIAEHRTNYLKAAQRVEPLLETLHINRVKASQDAFIALRADDEARERSAIAAAVAAVLLAVILAIVIAQRLSRGVAALVSYTGKITDGHLDAKAPKVGSKELGQLARALDTMICRLRESRDALAARHIELGTVNEALKAEVAERKRKEEMLHSMNRTLRVLSDSNQISAAVIKSSEEGVMVIDRALRIESVNPAFEKITGYLEAEAVGQKPTMLSSGKHGNAFFEHMHGLLDARGNWQGEIWNRRRSGELYPQQTSLSALRDPHGSITHYAAVFRDRTAEYQVEAKLRELASRDGLTGIANRRTFDETLAREWARAQRDGQPLSVAVADIDYFKRYNDSNGHLAGDDCLRQVARAIAGSANRASDLAARYGGEEFAVILPNTDADAAINVAEKLRASVAALALPHGASAAAPFVTVSIGVATVIPLRASQPGVEKALVASADKALYEAKTSGRNRVIAAPALDDAGGGRGSELLEHATV